jgi:hypothetical protein
VLSLVEADGRVEVPAERGTIGEKPLDRRVGGRLLRMFGEHRGDRYGPRAAVVVERGQAHGSEKIPIRGSGCLGEESARLLRVLGDREDSGACRDLGTGGLVVTRLGAVDQALRRLLA